MGRILCAVYLQTLAVACSTGSSPASVVDAASAGETDARVPSGCGAAPCDGGAVAMDADSGPPPPPSGQGQDAGPAARGLAAWVYSQSEGHVAEILAHQRAVGDDGLRFRYLFPYAGSLSVPVAQEGEPALSYDPAAAAYYGGALPGVLQLPIVDSGDGEALAAVAPEAQEQLADALASAVLDDPWAAGAHVDVEPFRDEHLPFYRRLGERLNAGGKTLAVFTGRTGGELYARADIVVLSGYDLGLEPLTREAYQASLTAMVATAAESAAEAGSSLLLGIPASASYEEYESGTGACEGTTGVTQDAWVAAALDAACPAFAQASFLGLSLWQLADGPLELGFEPGCARYPGVIPPEVWTRLAALRPDACGG